MQLTLIVLWHNGTAMHLMQRPPRKKVRKSFAKAP